MNRIHPNAQIHPTATVDPSAIIEEGVIIGAGSKIWHHCHIRKGACIGERCVLGKNVFVDLGVSIGNGVKIQNNVSVYHGVTIEDEVFVGPSVVFTNDPYPRAFLPWDPNKAMPTLVRRGASLGAGSCIRCGVEIGEYAMVGMGAVVTRTVGEFELWVGNPAKLAGRVDRHGQRT